MVRCRHDVQVDAPVERVYGVMADVDRWPEFMSALAGARRLNREADALNVEMREKAGGVEEVTRCRVVFRRPRGMKVAHRGGVLRICEVRWRLRPAAGGTRVTVLHRFAIGWPFVGPVLDRLWIGPRIMGPVVKRSLANFKRLVETGRSPKREPASSGSFQP